VSLGLDEGFEQHGFEAVALQPVEGQLAAGDGQDFGCESFALDPRQYEEPCVVDDELQVFEPLLLSGKIIQYEIEGPSGERFMASKHDLKLQ